MPENDLERIKAQLLDWQQRRLIREAIYQQALAAANRALNELLAAEAQVTWLQECLAKAEAVAK